MVILALTRKLLDFTGLLKEEEISNSISNTQKFPFKAFIYLIWYCAVAMPSVKETTNLANKERSKRLI